MAATNQMMLVALYNAANTELPHQVTDKEVTFGQPVALEKGDKNTKVTMTARTESENFKGAIELHYDRLEPGVVGRIEVTDDLALWTGENELRDRLQFYINKVKPDDSIAPGDVEYTTEDQKDEHDSVTLRTVTCTVTEQNLRYKPGVMATFVITPKVVDNRIDLATTDGELDGFTA